MIQFLFDLRKTDDVIYVLFYSEFRCWWIGRMNVCLRVCACYHEIRIDRIKIIDKSTKCAQYPWLCANEFDERHIDSVHLPLWLIIARSGRNARMELFARKFKEFRIDSMEFFFIPHERHSRFFKCVTKIGSESSLILLRREYSELVECNFWSRSRFWLKLQSEIGTDIMRDVFGRNRVGHHALEWKQLIENVIPDMELFIVSNKNPSHKICFCPHTKSGLYFIEKQSFSKTYIIFKIK